jgi:hypothetical protein
MNMANTESWSLGTVEYGKAVGAASGSKIKVYMGKVLPLVSFGKPKKKLVALNSGCFLNDSGCKPQISAQVRTVNYITVPANDQIDTSKIKHGTKLRIEVRNKSVDQLTVTNIE